MEVMLSGDHPILVRPWSGSGRAAVLALVLIAALAAGRGHCERGKIRVVVGGKAVQSDTPTLLEGGTVCGPLAAVARAAGYPVSYDPAGRSLTVVRPAGAPITLTLGSQQLRMGESVTRLKQAVRKRGGALVGPLAPLLQALGYRVYWKASSRLLVANGVLKRVTVRAGPSGALVTLDTSVPTVTQPVDLAAPLCCYLDLPGMETAKDVPPMQYIYTGPLARVRITISGSLVTSTRLTADLGTGAPTAWQTASGTCGGSLVIGEPSTGLPVIQRNLPCLTEVALEQVQLGYEILHVRVNWPTEPIWDVTANPPRISLTLPDVVYNVPETDLPVFSEFVNRVQAIASSDPPSTTLTAYLSELIQFDVRRPAEGGVQIVFRRERLQGKTVVIDPGHGGTDSGARGRRLLEKDVNLDVAQRVVGKLQALGVNAVLTRADDTLVDVHERPLIAERLGADLFVSIHCNAMRNRNRGRGTETFHWRQESKCLALLLQQALVASLQRPDRGVKRARFAVIRNNSMPSALVELMFLNDDTEEELLAQEATRERAAEAIVSGLRSYVEGSGVLGIGG